MERKGAELREGLVIVQREIQHLVALSVENLDTQHIESMQELPDEVTQKITNRDLLRAQHARELQCMMRNLLEGIQPSQYLTEGPEGLTTRSDLENVVQLLAAQDMVLEFALADACEGLQGYDAHSRTDMAVWEMGMLAP